MRTAWARVRALVRRWRWPASWERALHDELQAYLAHEIDASVRAGVPPAEARRAALADFGGLEQVKEQVRAGATGASLDVLRQDLRHACRSLDSSRRFAAWVAGSLAAGMTVTIAALAFLNALLFGTFPGVTRQERLVRVSVTRSCGRPDCRISMSSPSDYAGPQAGLAGLQGLAVYALGTLPVALPAARSMRGALTSANYFDVLGVRPAAGRSFDARDAETHAAVAVIAHAVWMREFNGDPSVIGQSIRVADEFVQIVGVAPAAFVGIDLKPARGDRGPDLWLPLWLADRVSPLSRGEQQRQARDVYFVGRLKDGADVSQVQAEAQVVASRLAAIGGDESRDATASVRRVWVGNPDHRAMTVSLVLPIPILVLLIACVNAANLMLARGSQRQREIAIRLAIGAGRGRLIRQLLIESALLTLLATAIAVPIARLGLHVADSPLSIPIPFDGTVLALTVLAAAVTTISFGLAPAVRATAQAPSTTLGPMGARGGALPRQLRLRRALVMAQVALSLGLLTTAWQLVATVRAQAVSTGTAPDRLLVTRFDLQPLQLPPGAMETFYRDVAAGASRLPGVEAAGLARDTSVWAFGQRAESGTILVWRATGVAKTGSVTRGGFAGADLFQAVGLRVLAGRGFTEGDRQPRPQVAVVNRTFASTTGSGLGSVLRVAPRDRGFGSSIEVRVVGIIEPALEPHDEPDDATPAVYLPSPIEPEPALALYVRTSVPARTLAQPVRDLVSRIAPRVPIVELGSVEELNERGYAPQLWLARAAVFLGIVGLVLATAGLYGVSSYVVAMRSREMAIRMAVGAAPRAILAMVLAQSMRVAAIGLLAGGAGAVVASLWIQSEYHGVQGLDARAFAGAAALFLASMAFASAVPAVRASRLDPVENLKEG